MCNPVNTLLDCVFDLKSRVCDLYSENFQEIFNRDSPGLNEVDAKSLLSDMYNNGYIEFFREQRKILLKDRINSAEIDSQWYFSLTEKGGELWESIYQPNWDLYVGVDSEFPADGSSSEIITIRTGTFEVLHNLLKELQIMPGYKEISPQESLHTWKPTYWKALTHGFTVTVLVGEESSESLAQYVSRLNWRNLRES